MFVYFRLFVYRHFGNLKLYFAAFHEAGHAVAANLMNWHIERIEIDTDITYGKTIYDFGTEKSALIILQKNLSNNNLSADESWRLLAAKRCNLAIAGIIAETLCLKGPSFLGTLTMVPNHHDYSIAESFSRFIANKIASSTGYVLNQQLQEITNILKHDIVWKTISEIAFVIISSKNHTIDRKKAEYLLSPLTKFRTDALTDHT